jgi:hypothetical protein
VGLVEVKKRQEEYLKKIFYISMLRLGSHPHDDMPAAPTRQACVETSCSLLNGEEIADTSEHKLLPNNMPQVMSFGCNHLYSSQ